MAKKNKTLKWIIIIVIVIFLLSTLLTGLMFFFNRTPTQSAPSVAVQTSQLA